MKLSGYGSKEINKEKMKPVLDKKNSNTASLKDGGTYKGRLISLDSGKVKVNIDGKEYSATVNKGSISDKNIGEQIEFKVSINGSELLIDIKNNNATATEIKAIDSLLMNLGLAKTDENKSLINILKEFNIPITKENFDELKSFVKTKNIMISTLGKIINDPENTASIAKMINKDLTLKENLLNIFKAEIGNSNKDSSTSLTNVASKSQISGNQSMNAIQSQDLGASSQNIDKSITNSEELQSKLNVSKTQSEDISNTEKSNENITRDGLNQKNKETNINLSKNLDKTIFSLKDTSENSKLDGKVNEVKSENNLIKTNDNLLNDSLVKAQNKEAKGILKIIDSLKNVDESTFAFNKEMQIPNVVKNLIGFDNLINMKDSIVNQLKNVLDAAFEQGDNKEKLTLILKELIDIKSDDFIKLDSILEKTKNALESQKTPMIDGLKEEIVSLKESINYIKEVNNQLIYMQTPIDINGKVRDFEMGIKKSKDAKDKSFKIFISLDTSNIGLVQSLIKINDSEIEIGFKVEKEYNDYFIENRKLLTEELEELGYKKIKISNIIREKKLNLTDLLRSEFKEESQFNFLV